MHKYCKAYLLKDLRQFPEWTEQWEEGEEALPSGETVVYLWDDFSVVKSPVTPGGVVFCQTTSSWQKFCRQDLHFAIPADLQYAYQAEESSHLLSEEKQEATSI